VGAVLDHVCRGALARPRDGVAAVISKVTVLTRRDGSQAFTCVGCSMRVWRTGASTSTPVCAHCSWALSAGLTDAQYRELLSHLRLANDGLADFNKNGGTSLEDLRKELGL
jgi:hypothetical protein